MSDKQHNAPQFYLRKWASNKATKTKLRIWVYNKITNEAKEELIKNVACSDSFFNTEVDAIITTNEDRWAKLHEELISKASDNIATNPDTNDLAEYIAFMYLRTKRRSEYTKSLIEDELAIDKSFVERYEIATGLDCSNEMYKKLHNECMKDSFEGVDSTVNLLKIEISTKYVFIYYRRAGGQTFLTSDQPVVHYANKETSYLVPVSQEIHFGDKLFFPLSPDTCLAIVTKSNEKCLTENRQMFMSEHEIQTVNRLQIAQSHSEIVSNKCEFKLCKVLRKNYPKILTQSAFSTRKTQLGNP